MMLAETSAITSLCRWLVRGVGGDPDGSDLFNEMSVVKTVHRGLSSRHRPSRPLLPGAVLQPGQAHSRREHVLGRPGGLEVQLTGEDLVVPALPVGLQVGVPRVSLVLPVQDVVYDLTEHIEEWRHDVVDKTDLGLRNLCAVSVTQRRDVQPQLSLLVALLEELLHAPGGPLLVELPALGRVGHVHSVEQETHDLRLLDYGGVPLEGAGHHDQPPVLQLLPLLEGLAETML